METEPPPLTPVRFSGERALEKRLVAGTSLDRMPHQHVG